VITYTQRLYSGTATANGNTHDAPVKVRYVAEAVFMLNITAITGTLDIEIQTYNSLTEEWHKLAVFTQKSTTGKDEGFIEYGLGDSLAIEYEVNGSATFSVDAVLKEC
jgi:hypothetical protein